MKTATIRRTDVNTLPRIPYPNAATKKELFHKFLDLLVIGAMGAGAAAMLLLVLVLH